MTVQNFGVFTAGCGARTSVLYPMSHLFLVIHQNVFWKKQVLYIYIYILQFYFFYNIWDDILNSWNPHFHLEIITDITLIIFLNKKNFNWIYFCMYSRVANKLTIENYLYRCEHSTTWNNMDNDSFYSPIV